jgi:hypothetical protein
VQRSSYESRISGSSKVILEEYRSKYSAFGSEAKNGGILKMWTISLVSRISIISVTLIVRGDEIAVLPPRTSACIKNWKSSTYPVGTSNVKKFS